MSVWDLARALGLQPGYHDQMGVWREAPWESVLAALRALGFDVAGDAEAWERLAALRAAREARALPEWVVVEAGAPLAPAVGREGDWRLTFEDGRAAEGRAAGGLLSLPALPLGRHRLEFGGAVTWLLAAPPRLPPPARGWGITLPLYGLPPEDGGGIGTYADLGRWAAAAGRAGAGFVGVNPVHAGFAEDPTSFSPYAPSHRRRFSTMHIAAGEGPVGAAPFVDHAAALRAKRAALEAAFAAGAGDDFARWRVAQGPGLEVFAVHQALSEVYGPYWTGWPEAVRDPASPEVAGFARAHAARVAFHAWLQRQAEAGLEAAAQTAKGAGMALGLYLDLAVGTHPAGAETWAERAVFAPGVSLGAPPDAFSPQGQTWGVAPFAPTVLSETGFAALAETLAAQVRFAGLLRIDHILGFERAFWVPQGLPGLYLTMPRAAMLAVARIEAAKAGASIVGEDLGNVPPGLSQALADSGILGCRVAMFERVWETGAFKDSGAYDPEVLACFGTHDLPTWKGWREGRDIDWRARLGRSEDPGRERWNRAVEVTEIDRAIGGRVGDTDEMHRFVGRSPCRLVALQVEDILGLEEQANLPGTIHEHPNWRRRLPVTGTAFAEDPRLAEAAAIMKTCGRQGGTE